jgi:predicted SprT family Zn-dependent metalloprotease
MTQVGVCYKSQKRIRFSKPLTDNITERAALSVITHEIAHGLAPVGSHHNAEWKRICLSIGGDGERCSRPGEHGTVAAEKTRKKRAVVGLCPNCHTGTEALRRTNVACGRCCKEKNGKSGYDAEFAFRWYKEGKDSILIPIPQWLGTCDGCGEQTVQMTESRAIPHAHYRCDGMFSYVVYNND